MELLLVNSQTGTNSCPPPGWCKKHRIAENYRCVINLIGTKDRIKRLLLFIAIVVHIPICTYSQNHYRSDSTQFFYTRTMHSLRAAISARFESVPREYGYRQGDQCYQPVRLVPSIESLRQHGSLQSITYDAFA